MIKANYHTHTTFCDGKDTAEDIVKYAVSLGMTHLGFSGHMDPEIHMDFPLYAAEIGRLKRFGKENGLDILTGVELDVLYEPAFTEEVEYMIGSTHYLDVVTEEPTSIDSSPEHVAFICDNFYSGDYYKMAQAYYELESSVYDRLHCTFIGHFDLITRFNDDMHFLDETDPRYQKAALSAMEYLVKKDVPFDGTADAAAYDLVLIGFPIWYYTAPLIIKSFLESYDFSAKRIVLFATSGGSNFGKTLKHLKASAPGADITEGAMLNSVTDFEQFKNL